jgi:hypothetical protein
MDSAGDVCQRIDRSEIRQSGFGVTNSERAAIDINRLSDKRITSPLLTASIESAVSVER